MVGAEAHGVGAVEKVEGVVGRVHPVEVLHGGEVAHLGRRRVLRLRPVVVAVAPAPVHGSHAAVGLGQPAEPDQGDLNGLAAVRSGSALRVLAFCWDVAAAAAAGAPCLRSFYGRLQHAVPRTRGVGHLLVVGLDLAVSWRLPPMNGEPSHHARGGASSLGGGASRLGGGACGLERGPAAVLRGGEGVAGGGRGGGAEEEAVGG